MPVFLLTLQESAQPCMSGTIYEAHLSFTPTTVVALCVRSSENTYYGLGIPTGVTALYHQKQPVVIDSAVPTRADTKMSRTQQPSGHDTETSVGSSDDVQLTNRLPVILGSIFGALGGIGIAVMSFYYGWRHAKKKATQSPLNNTSRSKAEKRTGMSDRFWHRSEEPPTDGL